jgi:hypothetical protein
MIDRAVSREPSINIIKVKEVIELIVAHSGEVTGKTDTMME